MMRKLHRWFGLVSGIFMIVIAITGGALQIEMTLNNHPAIRKSSPPPPTPGMEVSEIQATLGELDGAFRRIETKYPNFFIRTVEVREQAGRPALFVSEGDREGRRLNYDQSTDTWIEIPLMGPNKLHKFLIDLHAGFMFGPIGQILSFIMAISLVLFGVTGLVIYVDMFSKRRALGKKGWFW